MSISPNKSLNHELLEVAQTILNRETAYVGKTFGKWLDSVDPTTHAITAKLRRESKGFSVVTATMYSYDPNELVGLGIVVESEPEKTGLLDQGFEGLVLDSFRTFLRKPVAQERIPAYIVDMGLQEVGIMVKSKLDGITFGQ